jgi:hypothetical protein
MTGAKLRSAIRKASKVYVFVWTSRVDAGYIQVSKSEALRQYNSDKDVDSLGDVREYAFRVREASGLVFIGR